MKAPSREIKDRIYSAIPAYLLNRRQEILVGSMSGRHNISAWCQTHGVPEPSVETSKSIFKFAKQENRMLANNKEMNVTKTT